MNRRNFYNNNHRENDNNDNRQKDCNDNNCNCDCGCQKDSCDLCCTKCLPGPPGPHLVYNIDVVFFIDYHLYQHERIQSHRRKFACGFRTLINRRSFHTPTKSKIARTSYGA